MRPTLDMISTRKAIERMDREWKIGQWMAMKYQSIAEQTSVIHAAKLMRKQGVPVEMAVDILTRG